MIYNVVLKFGDRYITRRENTTWNEAKEFYGKHFVSLKNTKEENDVQKLHDSCEV
jgi:hypothetical protein